MKKFIEEIAISDRMLMNDIIHALEACPQSCASYDIEVKDREFVEDGINKIVSVVTIHRVECI